MYKMKRRSEKLSFDLETKRILLGERIGVYDTLAVIVQFNRNRESD